jgi:cyclic pyranopterin phosphate synthase
VYPHARHPLIHFHKKTKDEIFRPCPVGNHALKIVAYHLLILTDDMNTKLSSDPVLTHLDESGQVRMVDVSAKAPSQRVAIARARVCMSAAAYRLLSAQDNAKGEVLNTARVAGVLAAKRCAEMIPLCHSLPLSFVGIDFAADDENCSITILATCRTDYKTGVEMEAMTACSIAALTIYDMCKAADKGIVIEQVQLHYKSGGKSGEWRND